MTIKQLGYLIAALLIIAVFDLPYGYYTFLRIVVTGICAYYLYEEYKATGGRLEFMVILFGVLTILYNPIIPIHLEKGIWIFFNIVAAIAIGSYAAQKR